MPPQRSRESDVQIPLLEMYSETEDKKGGSDELKGQELAEHVSDSSTSAMDDDSIYSKAEQRAIIHRVDRRLVATAGLIYCFSLIDRGNLGNASIAGMTSELELSVGYRYSIIVLVFFPTYVIFQPLATVLCRKFGPRAFLATIALLWGVTEIVRSNTQDAHEFGA
ncbi:MAG: hypothetical protein Q9222_007822 [Ikaeria aurantiellina]